jgi:glycosyl transferase family 2
MAGARKLTANPRASVVVASVSSLDLLSACLDKLRPQCDRAGAEFSLIVARSASYMDGAGELERIAAGCRVVTAPALADLPRVRGAGLAQATGEWVLLTEDHVVADDNWVDTLLHAARPDAHVLGGSMGNARRQRIIDCGAFFAEYGIYGGRRAAAAGKGPMFAAANVAYRRSIVPDVAAWCDNGDWESVIHDRLHASGHTLLAVAAARVRQNESYEFAAFCRNRFEHGRTYAAVRAATWPLWRRVLHMVMTPLLPPLLAVRIAGAVSAEEKPDLWRAMPATLVYLCAWALGEAAGYARGAKP